jgi:dihydrolipoamide dehydrogenase
MSALRYDAVVIGAGPGGYPTASASVSSRSRPRSSSGSTWAGSASTSGCIPSKAVIHAAKTFEKIGHADELGITVGKPTIDMTKLQSWKGGVVNKLTSGVRGLLKGNGVDDDRRQRRLGKPDPDGHVITVTGPKGPQTIIAKNVVLATGSRPFEIPGFKTDQQRILDSTGALALDRVPGAHDRHRRRLHRPRARHGLRQARQQGHRRRGAAVDPRRRWTRTASRWSPASSRRWASR